MTARERWMTSLSKRPNAWLALGASLLFAANFRWGVGLLAWVAPVPLLRYLRVTHGLRARLAFSATLFAAWIATTLKIATGPLPASAAVLFGAGFAGIQLVGYLGADLARRRLAGAWGVLTFPAAMVSVEWIQHRCTPLASWGAAAYTQLDDQAVLQVASVLGMAGVSFLVYAVGASVESWLSAHLDGADAAPGRRQVALAVAAVVVAHVFGVARLAEALPGGTTVAAIGTDATFDGSVTPSDAERARTIDGLFASTDEAARAGAKLAVWTEAAALVMPDEEDALLERLKAQAAKDRIHIVAAYVVLESARPLRFANAYRWVRPDGVIDHRYVKHHPVPGEPADVGTGRLAAVDTELGRLGGALCYDYDFPDLAREHGALGVDLVALPSSDWRGIDPIHTQMAEVRAIEQGVSILRSTRFGLTAGIDPLGRVRAQRSSFETDDRVLVLDLPRHGLTTVYRRIGDVLVYASLAFLAFVIAFARGRDGRRTFTAPKRAALTLVVAPLLSMSVVGTARADERPADSRAARALGVSAEVDPLPFFAHGYSAALGYRWDHVRLSANVFAFDVPSFAVRDGWQAHVRWGTSLRAQYYFRSEARGFFVGAQAGPLDTRYSRDGYVGAPDVLQIQVTPTAGYRWFPFDTGLYVMPAAGLGITVFSTGHATVAGQTHPTPPLSPIAGLHLGWEL